MSATPKILLLDIETSLMETYSWGIRDQYHGLEDIIKDWSIISWAAKWLDEKRIYQEDQRAARDFRKDKKLLKGIWDLLDEADEIITQNGIAFDAKRLNARFAINNMGLPATYQHFDVYRQGKKVFNFTSHKLEYMCKILNLPYQKQKHNEYPGKELWKECQNGNQRAWKIMAQYNKADVLALESLYKKVRPYVADYNKTAYYGELVCSCGSRSFQKNGHRFTKTGRYQRLQCNNCGAEHRGEKA